MVLTPWDERPLSADQVMGRVATGAMNLPGVLSFPMSPSTLGRSTSSRPVQLVIGGSRHEEVGEWQAQVIAAGSELPELRGLLGTYRPTQPQLRVEVDRERAADLGVSVSVVGRTLETMLGSARRHDLRGSRRRIRSRPAGRGEPARLAHRPDEPLRAIGSDGCIDSALEPRPLARAGRRGKASTLQPAAGGDDRGQPGTRE